MEKSQYIAVDYTLHATAQPGEAPELVEATEAGRPFVFLTGFGVALEAFEQRVAPLAAGETFDFTLTPSEAFGERSDDRVCELDKEVFSVNGRFDSQHIRVGAEVPLQNEDGNRFTAIVLAITDDKVRVDLNHPLAGHTLHFKGTVRERREATAQEMQHLIKMMSGEGCGGCGGSCESCHHEGCEGCK